MEEEDKMVERIHVAIQQLMDERRKEKDRSKEYPNEEDGDNLLLSRLLSQLESLKKDASITHLPKDSSIAEVPASTSRAAAEKDETRDFGNEKMGIDEVLKELRKVKRQNSTTHWLLSIMIIITTVWQLSEISFLLTMKDKFSNPFKAVKDLIGGALKFGGNLQNSSSNGAPPLSMIDMPEFPRVELPSLALSNDEE